MRIIPVRYNGVTYRSRTEAKWAVFLNQIGIEYAYEPEGYLVEEGNKSFPYLPDFELHGLYGCDSVFLEVKPRTYTEADLAQDPKLRLFATQVDWLLLGIGDPHLNGLPAVDAEGSLDLDVGFTTDRGSTERDMAPDQYRIWTQAGDGFHDKFAKERRIALNYRFGKIA